MKTVTTIFQLLELLYHRQWTHLDGLGALVITPTRELAYQIFEVLNKVGKEHDFSAGLVIGECTSMLSLVYENRTLICCKEHFIISKSVYGDYIVTSS